MKIALLDPPFRLRTDASRWIARPPQGYDGIQWVVATLIDGLLAAGCELALLGAPGSPTTRLHGRIRTAGNRHAIAAFGLAALRFAPPGDLAQRAAPRRQRERPQVGGSVGVGVAGRGRTARPEYAGVTGTASPG
jgi:hypothetical protein